MDTSDPTPDDIRRRINTRDLLLRDALRFAVPCFGLSLAAGYLAIWIIWHRNPPRIWEAVLGPLIFAICVTIICTSNRIVRKHRAIFPEHRAIIRNETERVFDLVAAPLATTAVLLALAWWSSMGENGGIWIPLVLIVGFFLAVIAVGYLRGRRLVRRMETATKFKAIGSQAANKWDEGLTEIAMTSGEYIPATKAD